MNKPNKAKVSWITPRIGITDGENGQLAGLSPGLTVINVAAEVKNESATILLPLIPEACEKIKLDFLANYINYWMHNRQGQLVVHCLMGKDRSPLVVAWYFYRFRSKTLDEAYALIKEARPQVNDRRDWIVDIIPATPKTNE